VLHHETDFGVARVASNLQIIWEKDQTRRAISISFIYFLYHNTRTLEHNRVQEMAANPFGPEHRGLEISKRRSTLGKGPFFKQYWIEIIEK
jgi:hypothetical protein